VRIVTKVSLILSFFLAVLILLGVVFTDIIRKQEKYFTEINRGLGSGKK